MSLSSQLSQTLPHYCDIKYIHKKIEYNLSISVFLHRLVCTEDSMVSAHCGDLFDIM